MTTRNERLSELLRLIGESSLNLGDEISLELVEQEMPLFVKQLNSLLDDEFVAGYDYARDPTAPLLPGRNQRKTFYNPKPKRGPGRPRKNPELPPRPAGKHVSDAPDPSCDQ